MAEGDGTVTGSGESRMYTTKMGDTLEEIAAFFYGDPAHKQRLLDDNPELRDYSAPKLPGGMQIRVSKDAGRGDNAPGEAAVQEENPPA